MRKVMTRCLLALCSSLVGGVGVSSAAQPPGTVPSAATTERARALYREGVELYEVGRYERAYAVLLAAWSLKEHPQIAGTLGLVEGMLGMCRDAAEHLSFALRHDAPSGSLPEPIEVVQRRFREAKHAIGMVRVTVNIAGAELLVDGVSVGRSPLDDALYVEPGTRTIAARLAGYTEAKEVLQAAKGSELAVVLTLSQSVPWSGTTALVAPPVAQKRPLWPVLAGGVTGVVAALTGVVLLGVSAAQASRLSTLQDHVRQTGGCVNADEGDCAELKSVGRSQSAIGNAGFWTLVGGSTVGAATLMGTLVAESQSTGSSRGWHVVPLVTDVGSGLLVMGAF